MKKLLIELEISEQMYESLQRNWKKATKDIAADIDQLLVETTVTDLYMTDKPITINLTAFNFKHSTIPCINSKHDTRTSRNPK